MNRDIARLRLLKQQLDVWEAHAVDPNLVAEHVSRELARHIVDQMLAERESEQEEAA